MRIGLVRHFPVKRGLPGKRVLTREELLQWSREYEASDIEVGNTDLLGINWKRFFSSDLQRAIKTAETICNGKITKMQELREIPLSPVFRKNVRLHYVIWYILIRFAVMFSHRSQAESKAAVEERVSRALDEILEIEEDALIISHAAIMAFVRKELKRRGFSGPRLGTAENGKVYVFEREMDEPLPEGAV